MPQLRVMVRSVMSLHKLSAGDGYTYLTRQVAVQDSTERGLSGLGEYYAERGESPGVWLGRGTSGLDGFDATSPVSERQMVALFGEGRHPDADRIEQQQIAAGASVKAALKVSQLGSGFRVEGAPGAFRVQLAARFAAANEAAARPRTPRCRRRSGRGSARSWCGNCSRRSTAGRRWTRGSCPGSWPARAVRRPGRSPGTT